MVTIKLKQNKNKKLGCDVSWLKGLSKERNEGYSFAFHPPLQPNVNGPSNAVDSIDWTYNIKDEMEILAP